MLCQTWICVDSDRCKFKAICSCLTSASRCFKLLLTWDLKQDMLILLPAALHWFSQKNISYIGFWCGENAKGRASLSLKGPVLDNSFFCCCSQNGCVFIWSLFTHPHIFPNPNDLYFSRMKKSSLDTLQNISFCVQNRAEMTVLRRYNAFVWNIENILYFMFGNFMDGGNSSLTVSFTITISLYDSNIIHSILSEFEKFYGSMFFLRQSWSVKR